MTNPQVWCSGVCFLVRCISGWLATSTSDEPVNAIADCENRQAGAGDWAGSTAVGRATIGVPWIAIVMICGYSPAMNS